MKISRLTMMPALVLVLFTQCSKDNLTGESVNNNLATDALKKAVIPHGSYAITVENVSVNYQFYASGVSGIPVGASAAGPAAPGQSYKFSFHAGQAHMLSFATMYGYSNDGFYAPGTAGISLYQSDLKTPVTGDITSQVMLWDDGTEVNQMPGASNAHNGAQQNVPVQLMSAVGDGFNYGSVNTNLKVTLAYDGNNMFTVTIDNLIGSTTAISPVAWVIHTTPNPLFTVGMPDYGNGLKYIAQMGNATPLGQYLSGISGYVSPVAPVLWVLHDKKQMPIFTLGEPDYGIGLKMLAQLGDPGPLYLSLKAEGYITGTYATRDGGLGDGPLSPGQVYKFSVPGNGGDLLSLACMLGNSNDSFFANGQDGIKLSEVKAGEGQTLYMKLYDAGTQVNEYPGARTQAKVVEHANVALLNDGFPWPAASHVIKVTIRKNSNKEKD